jgi:hypothetical protein
MGIGIVSKMIHILFKVLIEWERHVEFKNQMKRLLPKEYATSALHYSLSDTDSQLTAS